MKLLRLIFISFIFTACVISPPDEGPTGRTVSFIRNIQTECSSPVKCSNESARNFNTIAIYTTAYCNNFDDDSNILAIGGGETTCADGVCNSFITNYTNGEGHKDFRKIIAGDYTVVVFLDINGNLRPSMNEPYFCSDEVDISSAKRNVEISIELTKLWGKE